MCTARQLSTLQPRLPEVGRGGQSVVRGVAVSKLSDDTGVWAGTANDSDSETV